jgi:hypothetical protein
VPLIYRRSEQDGRIEIQVKPAWYVARYATLPFALPLIVLGPRLGMMAVYVCAAGLLGSLLVRIFGLRAVRRELHDAMRRGVLQLSGSAWDYRHPLRYGYTRPLPPATVVKDGH